MPRADSVYKCKECGFQTTNWMGRCSSCGNWNTFIKYDKNSEKVSAEGASDSDPGASAEAGVELRPELRDNSGRRSRLITGIAEFDRVLGGGMVPGSLALLGGAPGVGKSTLVLQIAHRLALNGCRCLYIAGEESEEQLALRAERLGTFHDNIKILTAAAWQKIFSHCQEYKYDLIIVDSIQTVYDSSYDSSPGSVRQVREMTSSFQQLAKGYQVPIFLVGHVTKQGQLAGPKTMEHIVDTVLYFQDSSDRYRLLKAHKNRYGAIDEVGVFTMRDSGLEEVSNPSSAFLQGRPGNCSGSVVVPVKEGSRTLLIELQALVSTGGRGNPRRITSGLNRERAELLLAVLDKRLGLDLAERDVHFNIVGGIEVKEPALDLALAAAVISSYYDIAFPADLSVFGEVGLAGEIRAVSSHEKRTAEAAKMGFDRLILPASEEREISNFPDDIELVEVNNIKDLLSFLKSIK